MRFIDASSTLLLSLAALLASGCAMQPNMPLPVGREPFDRNALVVYVPGIGGFGTEDRGWVKGLRAGGYQGEVVVDDWTGRLSPLAALFAHDCQRTAARHIAARIRQARSKLPSAPIVVVGHSAGAGVAVEVLEDLPPEAKVDELLLVAPAMSRTYDLTRALRHVRGRADVFYSERDTLVLAVATSIFGTVDGVHGEAAGHGGFVMPPRASRAAYAKLRQHPYSRDREAFGDDGGHAGALAPGVAARIVVPLLPGHDAPESALANADAYPLP